VLPRRAAGVISGQTSFTHVRPRIVDRASRLDTDSSDKGRAAIAVAPHACTAVIDECGRDSIEINLALEGKSRPFCGKGAARTTTAARSWGEPGLLPVKLVHLTLSLTADTLPRLFSISYPTTCPSLSVPRPASIGDVRRHMKLHWQQVFPIDMQVFLIA